VGAALASVIVGSWNDVWKCNFW